MNRIEAWLLHLSTLLISVTGLVYAWMHYLLKPSDPFAVVNHPWEPYMMDAHILLSPFLVIGLGMILHSHILFKLETGSLVSRKTGITLIPLFAVMVASGYLLQVITGDARKFLVVFHLASGTLWAVLYLSHQIASIRFRRRMARQNEELAMERKTPSAIARS